MKTKLLFSAFLLSMGAFAQEPITSFYSSSSTPNSNESDIYDMLSTAGGGALDQTTPGANITWNFTDLTVVGQSYTTIIAPTAQEIADYPGTGLVVRTLDGNSETSYYLAENAQGTSLAGAETSGIVLNYTNNAFIGNFPLNYGYTGTDDVAGTFETDGVQGTFTGTGTVAVDAYGTLSVNGEPSSNVTRLKTVQQLDLIYMGVSAGTVTQTIYSYYSNPAGLVTGGPRFRSITTHVVVPLLSMDETSNVIESYFGQTLGLNNPITAVNTLAIAPNPVANVLHFSGNQTVNSVTITDVTGKMVLSSNVANDIDVSGLNAGVYFVAVQAANGTEVKKMIKQ